MNITSFKALLRLLFATFIFLASDFALAKPIEATVINDSQQIVHLNNSTVEQLLTLKGIGQKKAEAIVAYREQIGTFKSIDDLMNVKGVGEKIILDNKSRLKI